MAIHADGTEATVNFIVGGVYHSLLLSDIQTHKDSYFASVIKDEWNHSAEPIVIDRDGVLFQHIFVYISNRRYKMPFTVQGSLSLLVSVRREADYYNLPELVAACDETYEREMTKWCKTQPLPELCNAYTLQSDEITELDALVSSEVYPGCHIGKLDEVQLASESVTNALITARLLPNSTKQKNFYDLHIREAYEYLESLEELLPSLPGVSCCIDRGGGVFFAVKEGGYQEAIALNVPSPNRIGTALYIMHSEYTGGVITVSKNGVSRSITQPGEYILYTGDLHFTDPDSLQDRDAVLYACLKDTFDVTVVTVYVQRGGGTTAGCVLGLSPAHGKDGAVKTKIVAPFHGFRESFEVNISGAKSTQKHYANLCTALYIAMQ